MNRSYILALCLFPTVSRPMMDRFKLRSDPKPPRFQLKEKPFERQPLLSPNIQDEYDPGKEHLDKARQHDPKDYLKIESGRTQPYYQPTPRRRSFIDHLIISLRVLVLPCYPQSSTEDDDSNPAGSL